MGVSEKQIARINELAHKAKAEGLTTEEKMEKQVRRAEYMAAFKASLKAQRDNMDIKEEDGTIVNLGEKYGAENGKKGN